MATATRAMPPAITARLPMRSERAPEGSATRTPASIETDISSPIVEPSKPIAPTYRLKSAQ